MALVRRSNNGRTTNVLREYFQGDGVTTEFTLSQGTIAIVEVSGQIMEEGAQYIRDGRTITFGLAPDTDERIGLIGLVQGKIRQQVFDESFDQTFG